MGLQHCERCRFNFESTDAGASCPQCGESTVPAENASRSEESSQTRELEVIPLPDAK
jgi:uncharacterized Zn finger protein (UPF0148 family)